MAANVQRRSAYVHSHHGSPHASSSMQPWFLDTLNSPPPPVLTNSFARTVSTITALGTFALTSMQLHSINVGLGSSAMPVIMTLGAAVLGWTISIFPWNWTRRFTASPVVQCVFLVGMTLSSTAWMLPDITQSGILSISTVYAVLGFVLVVLGRYVGTAPVRHLPHRRFVDVESPMGGSYNPTPFYDSASVNSLGWDGEMAVAAYLLCTALMYTRFFAPLFCLLWAIPPFVVVVLHRAVHKVPTMHEPLLPVWISFISMLMATRLFDRATYVLLDGATVAYALCYIGVGVVALLRLLKFFSDSSLHRMPVTNPMVRGVCKWTTFLALLLLLLHPDHSIFVDWFIRRFVNHPTEQAISSSAEGPMQWVEHMWYWSDFVVQQDGWASTTHGMYFSLWPPFVHFLRSSVLLVVQQMSLLWLLMLSAHDPGLLCAQMCVYPGLVAVICAYSAVPYFEHMFRHTMVGYSLIITLLQPLWLLEGPRLAPLAWSNGMHQLRVPDVITRLMEGCLLLLRGRRFVALCVSMTLLLYHSPWGVFTPRYSPDHAASVHETSFLWRTEQKSYQSDAPQAIPKVVHLTWPGGKRSFDYVHYLVVRSVHLNLKPHQITIHYSGPEPSDRWWKQAKGMIVVKPHREVYSFFGRPVVEPAHRADVQRMEILLEFGGIYLDTDVLALADFEPLLEHEFVMGKESATGLCNAVMLSRPNARFLREWYRRSRTAYLPDCWDCQSVQFPFQLAQRMPEAITVLHQDAFFSYEPNMLGLYHLFAKPLSPSEEQIIREGDTTDPRRVLTRCTRSGRDLSCMAVHLWMSLARRKGLLTENTITKGTIMTPPITAFNLMALGVAGETD